jgi:DNA-directed RNA polymerase subunit M/transcription elongation factor TFIIS
VIRFSCPSCERVIEVGDEDAGRKMSCPTCGQRLEVPSPARTVLGKPEPRAEPQPEKPRRAKRVEPDEDLVAIEDCPECGKALQVEEDDIGHRVECVRCGHRFVARRLRKRRRDDEDDYRPRRRRTNVRPDECRECGADLDDEDRSCPECGARTPGGLSVRQLREANNKKNAAAVCGFLFGGLGVHKFVLGFTTPGVIMLLVTLLTCGIAKPGMWIIGIIEGITYLSKSDEEFYRIYMVGKKEWF